MPNESKREKEYFENLIRKIPKDDIEIESFHIFGITDLRILSSDADIIVAHGITFHAIQQIFPKKHLVEITTNGFDILSAISQAKKKWPEQKIALCMHNEFLKKEYDPQTLFDNPVCCLLYTSQNHWSKDREVPIAFKILVCNLHTIITNCNWTR